jgi:hypothetical protein
MTQIQTRRKFSSSDMDKTSFRMDPFIKDSILYLQEDDSKNHAPFFGGHLMLRHYQNLFRRYRSDGFSEIWY